MSLVSSTNTSVFHVLLFPCLALKTNILFISYIYPEKNLGNVFEFHKYILNIKRMKQKAKGNNKH